MASTNMVIASPSTTTNSELPRQSSICSLSTFIADFQHHHPTDDDGADDGEEQSAASGVITSSVSAMDDLLKNIYSDSPQPPQQSQHHPPPESPFPAAGVDEVWKRIVAGGTDQRLEADDGGGAMTLEDFLTKNGAVREEDVRVPVGGYGQGPGQFQAAPMTVYGNGSGSAAPARGKRRAIEEPLDKATQQKQRRMIKNRESAARSRERKQAYTVELEALVTQLEEENSRMLREEAERKKERFKQLMEKLVPVVEKVEKKEKGEKEIVENFAPNVEKTRTRTRTPGVLRRVYSAEW